LHFTCRIITVEEHFHGPAIGSAVPTTSCIDLARQREVCRTEQQNSSTSTGVQEPGYRFKVPAGSR